MDDLLKLWKAWKVAPKECTCDFEPLAPHTVRVVGHKDTCPARDYLTTDVGVFLDSLTRTL